MGTPWPYEESISAEDIAGIVPLPSPPGELVGMPTPTALPGRDMPTPAADAVLRAARPQVPAGVAVSPERRAEEEITRLRNLESRRNTNLAIQEGAVGGGGAPGLAEQETLRLSGLGLEDRTPVQPDAVATGGGGGGGAARTTEMTRRMVSPAEVAAIREAQRDRVEGLDDDLQIQQYYAELEAKIERNAWERGEQLRIQGEGVRELARTKFGSVLGEIQRLSEIARNSQVDPDRAWSSMSGGARIGAAIALAMESFARGLNPNVPGTASRIIESAIERDIQAQRDNLELQYRGIEVQRGILADMVDYFDDEEAGIAASRVLLGQQTSAMIAHLEAERRYALAPIAAQQLRQEMEERNAIFNANFSASLGSWSMREAVRETGYATQVQQEREAIAEAEATPPPGIEIPEPSPNMTRQMIEQQVAELQAAGATEGQISGYRKRYEMMVQPGQQPLQGSYEEIPGVNVPAPEQVQQPAAEPQPEQPSPEAGQMPEDEARVMYSMAQDAERAGDYQGAMNILAELNLARPGVPEVEQFMRIVGERLAEAGPVGVAAPAIETPGRGSIRSMQGLAGATQRVPGRRARRTAVAEAPPAAAPPRREEGAIDRNDPSTWIREDGLYVAMNGRPPPAGMGVWAPVGEARDEAGHRLYMRIAERGRPPTEQQINRIERARLLDMPIEAAGRTFRFTNRNAIGVTQNPTFGNQVLGIMTGLRQVEAMLALTREYSAASVAKITWEAFTGELRPKVERIMNLHAAQERELYGVLHVHDIENIMRSIGSPSTLVGSLNWPEAMNDAIEAINQRVLDKARRLGYTEIEAPEAESQ